MRIRNFIPVTFLIVVIAITCVSPATTRDDLKSIAVSGGELHTLVLMKNKSVWACGDNYYSQLGTGADQYRDILTRVLKGDMNSPSDYLEDINDVDAGWTHSLALDVNGFVWEFKRFSIFKKGFLFT